MYVLRGLYRSLVAYLAAANHFKKAHIDKPENRALLEKAKYYYMSVSTKKKNNLILKYKKLFYYTTCSLLKGYELIMNFTTVF